MQLLDFENIGFTKPKNPDSVYRAEKLRYLICAGCDIGPIGYEALGGNQFFIAADRVRYDA